MHTRHLLGALFAVGLMSGCGTQLEADGEPGGAAPVVSALDACDGSFAWEYNFYSDASHLVQVGGIICKCRGHVATWGDTSTPYISYWSEACPSGEAR